LTFWSLLVALDLVDLTQAAGRRADIVAQLQAKVRAAEQEMNLKLLLL
jgi:hypothetical protein